MRNICLIGLCVFALCGRANATVSGFSDNSRCGGCVAFMGCAAQVGYNRYGDRGDCGTLSSSETDKIVNEAIAECSGSSFPTSNDQQYLYNVANDGVAVGMAYYWDTVCHPGLTLEQLRQTKVGYALEFLDSCRETGACYCGGGTYVQPMGLVNFSWGTNSQCVACPTSGTSMGFSMSTGGAFFITSCYIPSGSNFSDITGEGKVTDKCSYVADEDDITTTVQ